MRSRLALAAVVFACLCATGLAQSAPPSLTRQQKASLQLLIDAVDKAAREPGPPASDEWLTHVLRASDGSHYIAFSLTPSADALPAASMVIYVRLATASVPGGTMLAERSLVREWLKGSRIDPRMLPQRGMAIGEMPAMGAGANITRGGVSAVGSPDLQAMALQRERARQRRDDEERKRKAQLEGSAVTASDHLPFEDFEIGSAAVFADGTRAIQRALTSGPGAYDLYVAWVDASLPSARAPVHLARRPIRLAPAAAEFGLSSVIVADRIGVRDTPYSSLEQRAHPYSIGPTDISPSRDLSLAPAERLALAFQIFNAAPTAAGKPNVVVTPRIVRLIGMREEPVASLSPLIYDAGSMPEDFDLRLGHPIIAALAAPLSTLRRGEYKLVITAEDRQAGAMASTMTPFTIITTPAGLLAEAPPLAQRLEPAAMLRPSTVAQLLDALAVTAPSPALTRALESARAGRFADLLIEDRVGEGEQAARAVLTGLALLSVGDLGAIAQFQRAATLGARPAPVQYLLGAAFLLQRRDADAIAAFERATADGLQTSMTAPLIATLRLLRGDAAGAAAAIAPAVVAPTDGTALKTLAATRIAVQHAPEAVEMLTTFLESHAGDAEARWLLVHALYADWVNGNLDRHDRLVDEARRYIDAGGPHAALAAEWLKMVTAS